MGCFYIFYADCLAVFSYGTRYLGFGSSGIYTNDYDYRFYGLNVRPVRAQN